MFLRGNRKVCSRQTYSSISFFIILIAKDMPDKNFLESYPLYKKHNTGWKDTTYSLVRINQIPKPAIHMHCEVCCSDQTFNMVNEYYEIGGVVDCPISGMIVRAEYICSACRRGKRIFLIKISESPKSKKEGFSIQKVGQYPAWSIDMDKELEKILGEYSDLYKKGLICESQSYGIGAYGYFRRITEDVIDKLLDSISDLIDPDEKGIYQAALKKTKQTRIAQEKIDLIKDLLPNSLKPDGTNPLGVLHSALSDGMHKRTDEECMDQAEIIRSVLIFLVNQIIRTKNESRKFTLGIKKLLDKKSENKSQ